MSFFSLIIPTYNRAHLISKTLESVRLQTFGDVEVIIVDDGSTDDTGIVMQNYLQQHALPNWHYHRTHNRERGAARNTGIRLSGGQFITFLDSDDIIYETHLQKAHDYLVLHQDITVLHSAYEIGASGRNSRVPYKDDPILNGQLLQGNLLSCFGMFVHRTAFDEVLFSEKRELSGSEDWLLWLRLSARHFIYLQAEITGCMVEHAERSVLNFSPAQLNNRAEGMVHELQHDEVFMNTFGHKTVNAIHAHMLSYGALHLILLKNKREGLILFGKALSLNYKELFSLRTLGILKHLLA